MPSGPLEHHLPSPLFTLCLQNTSAVRDRLRGPCAASCFTSCALYAFCAVISVKRLCTGLVGWIRPMPRLHKARAALSSPPSAPLNGITELFDQPIPTMSRESCVPWIL